MMLIAYCSGFITVCTVLLFIATILTYHNYQLLRRLSEGSTGQHDVQSRVPERAIHAARRSPSERYDSGMPEHEDIEWSGPVTAYTPSDRSQA